MPVWQQKKKRKPQSKFNESHASAMSCSVDDEEFPIIDWTFLVKRKEKAVMSVQKKQKQKNPAFYVLSFQSYVAVSQETSAKANRACHHASLLSAETSLLLNPNNARMDVCVEKTFAANPRRPLPAQSPSLTMKYYLEEPFIFSWKNASQTA